ncbi:putative xyloglucan endotransglucosylase/hydrolase protein 28 [Panicum miliaceum]|uniref:Xyloglucan endotransglucosylase/hydrolase n=1 Tax=Panicum miliaceum TaxID=4540 RepID=A0A3L6QU38_PANMI|nr:putative xyloglucan endotransglucosylase/hydrolase protein 28 [Panicum miliaceum]
MASGASSSPALPVPSLAAVVVVLLLAVRGEARPPHPLRGVRPLAFDEGYAQIFGSSNLALLRDGRRVRLALDESTGAGFASQDLFLHGFFSAAIRLPADYAAGVVVAFYLSNGDVYEKTHDELDFEFLGNVRGREWRVQTNVYGNGSTHAGREERYDLPFDPTDDFHHYSILWTSQRIIFYVDETPIREVVRTAAMGATFPSKPMSLYATIWDGSTWATLGGRYRVNYRYAPFVAEFADLVIRGCAVDPPDRDPRSAACEARVGLESLAVPAERRAAMAAFRRAHTSYSYCHDRRRYPVALVECGAGALLPGRMFGPDGMRQHGRRHRAGAGAAARGGRRGGAQDDVM